MRTLAPRDPELPAALAERLAADEDDRVRSAVATHLNVPVPALLALLADENERVAVSAARSPVLPLDLMEQFLALAAL